jgi:hypothetical protein
LASLIGQARLGGVTDLASDPVVREPQPLVGGGMHR